MKTGVLFITKMQCAGHGEWAQLGKATNVQKVHIDTLCHVRAVASLRLDV
jgi:hypothetical protein